MLVRSRLCRSRGLLWYLSVLLLTFAGSTASFAAGPALRILIDINDRRLSVLQDNVVKRTYQNISIGRGGSTAQRVRHDDKTPLGEFRIVRMTSDTTFHRFFALDYPDLQRAESAREAGIISRSQYVAIRQASRTGQMPPQDTPLGGHIGIYGIGKGDRQIHEDFNWTNGCVALTNEQIDDLSRWIDVGTKVTIRH